MIAAQDPKFIKGKEMPPKSKTKSPYESNLGRLATPASQKSNLKKRNNISNPKYMKNSAASNTSKNFNKPP